MPRHVNELRTIFKARGYYQESVDNEGCHHFYKSEYDLNPLGIPVDPDGFVSDVMCAIIEYLLAVEDGDEIDPK